MEMAVEIYEQSAIAFIDILGFKNALKDKSKASGILQTLSAVKSRIEEHYSDPSRHQFQYVLDIEITAFSDSVVISGSESQIAIVLMAALDFSQLLIEKGFLCRGAIECGELHHNNGVLFGSGFVSAYESERYLATYPRIILAPRAVELISDSKNDPSDFAGLIRSDNDGREFLNLLFEMGNTKTDLARQLSKLIQDELENSDISDRTKQKLTWVQREYSL